MAIVYDDADLDAFETDIRWEIYFNAGQACSAMSLVIVHYNLVIHYAPEVVPLSVGLHEDFVQVPPPAAGIQAGYPAFSNL